MLIEGTIPVTTVSLQIETRDPAAAVRRFLQTYPDARPEALDGQIIRGVCACGSPVLEDTKGYRYDQEQEVYVCPACNAQQARSQP